MKSLIVLLGSIVLLSLGGCAIDPVLKKGQTAQIVEVKVTAAKGISGTANLPEAVRYKTQNNAYRFSESGPEKVLNLHVTGVRISNPGAALLIGGESVISAEATLVDKSSGVAGKPFPSLAIIPRLGGIIGAIAAAGVDVIQEEQRLSGMLAEDVLMRIYGEEYAASVARRIPSKQVTPNYPISYEKARKQIECENIRSDNEIAKADAAAQEEEPTLTKVPGFCQDFSKSSS